MIEKIFYGVVTFTAFFVLGRIVSILKGIRDYLQDLVRLKQGEPKPDCVRAGWNSAPFFDRPKPPKKTENDGGGTVGPIKDAVIHTMDPVYVVYPGSERVDLGDKCPVAICMSVHQAKTLVTGMWPGIGYHEEKTFAEAINEFRQAFFKDHA